MLRERLAGQADWTFVVAVAGFSGRRRTWLCNCRGERTFVHVWDDVDLRFAYWAGLLSVGVIGMEHLDRGGTARRLGEIGVFVSRVVIYLARVELL